MKNYLLRRFFCPYTLFISSFFVLLPTNCICRRYETTLSLSTLGRLYTMAGGRPCFETSPYSNARQRAKNYRHHLWRRGFRLPPDRRRQSGVGTERHISPHRPHASRVPGHTPADASLCPKERGQPVFGPRKALWREEDPRHPHRFQRQKVHHSLNRCPSESLLQRILQRRKHRTHYGQLW